ncbi:hypothetical protein Tco_1423868, partial [Tanacetum coccineum]
AVHKELGDRMERAATTASSLEAEQDSVNATVLMLMLPVQVPAAEEKPVESDGFAEIIDFLKASSETEKVQIVNGVRQLQALVDKKRVIITESSIQRDLHLDDAEGTDCLLTVTIFEELECLGYEKLSQKLTFYKAFFSPQWKYFIHTITQCISAKSTAWNEFSCSMASLIICLATNQKFNLSKYIFDAIVKHLDGGIKFLMYLRFLQVFINQQLGDMSTHKKICVNPFHTKKVFANMKRAGKDFSGRITPLFNTMMVQAFEEVGEDSDHLSDFTQVHLLDPPSTSSKPKNKQPSKKTQRQEARVSQDETEHEEKKSKYAQAKEIVALKKMIQKLEKEEDFKNYMFKETQEVLDADEMPVEAKVDEKDEQSTKLHDSIAGEAVTAACIKDSAAHTNNKEITLAQTLIQIKAAKPKVVTTAATTTTTTRPKAKRVVVKEPSEFRVPQEAQPLTTKDKGKAIMVEPEVPLKRKDQTALDEKIARDIQAKLDAELIEEQKLARK